MTGGRVVWEEEALGMWRDATAASGTPARLGTLLAVAKYVYMDALMTRCAPLLMRVLQHPQRKPPPLQPGNCVAR